MFDPVTTLHIKGDQCMKNKITSTLNSLHLHFEILLLKFTIWVLKSRNFSRSKFISRADNNSLWYMHEKIESIAERMQSKYNDTEN